MKWMARSILALLLIFSAVDCADAQVYSIPLLYQPKRPFPALQQKLGPKIGIAPFKDERQEKSYIGIHLPLQGLSTHFETVPMPLERALEKSLSDALSWQGMKVGSVSNWDATPESLKVIDADSVLTIEIKKFWSQGTGSLFRSNIKTTIHLVIYLGVKKEGKVFTRNVEMEKEVTVPRSTPERVGAIINEILTNIFDTYFFSPY